MRLGHVSQSRSELDPEKTVYQEIAGDDDVLVHGGGQISMRNYVATVCFPVPFRFDSIRFDSIRWFVGWCVFDALISVWSGRCSSISSKSSRKRWWAI